MWPCLLRQSLCCCIAGRFRRPHEEFDCPLRGGAVDVLHGRDEFPVALPEREPAKLLGQGGSQFRYDRRAGMVLFPQRRQRVGPEFPGFRRQGLRRQCGSLQGLGRAAELRAQQVLPVHAPHPEDQEGVPVELLAQQQIHGGDVLAWIGPVGTRAVRLPGRPAGRGTWTGRRPGSTPRCCPAYGPTEGSLR